MNKICLPVVLNQQTEDANREEKNLFDEVEVEEKVWVGLKKYIFLLGLCAEIHKTLLGPLVRFL